MLYTSEDEKPRKHWAEKESGDKGKSPARCATTPRSPGDSPTCAVCDEQPAKNDKPCSTCHHYPTCPKRDSRECWRPCEVAVGSDDPPVMEPMSATIKAVTGGIVQMFGMPRRSDEHGLNLGESRRVLIVDAEQWEDLIAAARLYPERGQRHLDLMEENVALRNLAESRAREIAALREAIGELSRGYREDQMDGMYLIGEFEEAVSDIKG